MHMTSVPQCLSSRLQHKVPLSQSDSHSFSPSLLRSHLRQKPHPKSFHAFFGVGWGGFFQLCCYIFIYHSAFTSLFFSLHVETKGKMIYASPRSDPVTRMSLSSMRVFWERGAVPLSSPQSFYARALSLVKLRYLWNDTSPNAKKRPKSFESRSQPAFLE